jgi:tetratricopeptide (TPR) repeat protein
MVVKIQRSALTGAGSQAACGNTSMFCKEKKELWNMISYATRKVHHKHHLVALLMLIGFLTSTASSLGAEQNDVSPKEQERTMKLAGGDLSVATNEIERFYALGRAARNALRHGKVKEAEVLANELARLAPKYKNDWNYGNAIEDSNQVLGRIALSKGDIAEAKKHLLASAHSQGSPQLNSFGPDFGLARELAEKGERDTVIAFLDSVARFWANPHERTEANSKQIANEHGKQLEAWKQQLRAGEVPNHPKWR